MFLVDPLLPELTNDSVLVWSGDTVGYRGVAFLSGAPTLTSTDNVADGNGASELDGARSVFVQGDYAYVVGLADDGMEICYSSLEWSEGCVCEREICLCISFYRRWITNI